MTTASPPGADVRRAAPRFRSNTTGAGVALALAVVAQYLLLRALKFFYDSLSVSGGQLRAAQIVTIAVALAGFSTLFFAGRALFRATTARRLWAAGERGDARIAAEDSRNDVSYVVGIILAVFIVAFLFWFISNNDGEVRRRFLKWSLIWDLRRGLWKGFWINIKLFLVAQVLVLVWSLVVAVVRQLPGRGAAPVRWLATAYSDIFRGVPALIVIYLIVLGFPIAKVPPFADMADKDAQKFWLAVLALVLVYGAYVAEVYRAGLESIHWSQVAAARSLGLSQFQTLRFVVVPQAVRRIIPPLLNDFIALQKDTALVSFAGVLEVLNRATIAKSQYFNFSPVTGAALFFLVITIPMTRFVDWLIRREQARTRAG
jgi:polar amino acid transport system permease protein